MTKLIDIYDLLKYFFSALIFSYFLFPVFIKLLERRKILDAPDIRKIHRVHTPSMGGIPLFLGVIFALLIWFPPDASYKFKYIFGALAITFVIGLRDDLIPLRPIYKLISQFIPAIMIIYLANINLSSFYSIANINFPDPLTWIITIFVIIVITNSINLIDGLDGLAASVSFIALGTLGTWFFLIESYELSFVIYAFLGATLSFLWFNWQPSKIFMGDTGALLIGFLQAFVIIIFINTNYNLPDNSLYKFKASIGTAICIMIIPLLDTLRVFVIRLLKAQSPFTADNNHIHHLLISIGLSHSASVLILASIHLVFIGIAISLKDQDEVVLISFIVTSSAIMLTTFNYLRVKAKAKKASI